MKENHIKLKFLQAATAARTFEVCKDAVVDNVDNALAMILIIIMLMMVMRILE